MQPNGHTTITLADKTYTVRIPTSFADREDIVSAWAAAKDSRKSRRVFGATIALCTPDIAALVKGASPDDDLVAYGKAAYDALRGLGVAVPEITGAAREVYALVVQSLFPRKDEVEKTEDFSEGGAAGT